VSTPYAARRAAILLAAAKQLAASNAPALSFLNTRLQLKLQAFLCANCSQFGKLNEPEGGCKISSAGAENAVTL
jgi:hypothetical protein